MQTKFTEGNYEEAIIELFTNELEYDYLPGPDIDRDYSKVILEDLLREKLKIINPNADKLAIDEAMRKVLNTNYPNLLENNKIFHEYLTSGISVNYYKNGNKSDHAAHRQHRTRQGITQSCDTHRSARDRLIALTQRQHQDQ